MQNSRCGTYSCAASNPGFAKKEQIMAASRQGTFTTQVQKQEQRQTASSQQILAAHLTELSVEELLARIKAECDENPWLESSMSSTGDNDYADSDASDSEEEDLKDSDEAGDCYAPETGDYISDDDFPQPQQQTDGDTGRDTGDALTFYDILTEQMSEYELTEHEQDILQYLIGSLDADGLLRQPLHSIVDELEIHQYIQTNEQEVERILGILQQFEPKGVGARNLTECLLIQVKQDHSLPMRSQLIKLLTEYSEEMNLCHWDAIEKRMKLTHAELETMRKTLRRLNPKPGGSVGATPAESNHHIVPDFIVTADEDNGLHFHLNESNLPTVTLAEDYTDESALLLVDSSSEKWQKELLEAQKFQRTRIEEGRMFIEALATRRRSMLLTMGAILRLQKDFFLEGDWSMLRPMKLMDISELTHLDNSTISRVCRSKTVETPFGVFALNKLFTSKVEKSGEELSVQHIMQALREIVDSEDKHKPYSDSALTEKLKEKGYSVARRTVAKYRDQLGIPDSRMRR